MKDHEIAQLVNALRDCAVEFHNAQQLRERIAALVVPALRELSQSKYAALMLDLLAARARGEDEEAIADQMDAYQQPSSWKTRPSPAFVVSLAIGELQDVRRKLAALQQSSSGITAGAEKPSQVVDFGAAAQTRTGDLLITNQDKNTPETSNNQDVTPKTAPAQPAQVAPTESSGCEGVTAALDVIRFALQDASRLVVCADETHPKLCGLARGSLLKAHDAWHVIAAQWADRDPNARWLTLAHNLCADAGVPSGHIADRLEGLRAVLESHA